MLRAISTAALGLGLAAVTSSPALALARETTLVHIPFAFSVGGEPLPAGDYRIARLNDIDREVLVIRSSDGRYATFAFTLDAAPAGRGTQPELVFDRYGTQEFLHAIRLPDETGAVLEPSAAEIRAARELGAGTANGR